MTFTGGRDLKYEEKMKTVKLKRPRNAETKRTVTCTDCGVQLHWASLARHRKRHQPLGKEPLGNEVTNKDGEEVLEKTGVLEDVQMKPEYDGEIEAFNESFKEDIEAKKKEKTNHGLCEYELIRLENIRQREALFAELNLDAAKVEASSMIEKATVAPPIKRGRQTEKRETEMLPTRASTRLAIRDSIRVMKKRSNSVPKPEVQRNPETDGGFDP